MRYINIRITDEGLDPAVKAMLTRGCEAVLRQVLGAGPALVAIDELHLHGIGMAGLGIEEYRALARREQGA